MNDFRLALWGLAKGLAHLFLILLAILCALPFVFIGYVIGFICINVKAGWEIVEEHLDGIANNSPFS